MPLDFSNQGKSNLGNIPLGPVSLGLKKKSKKRKLVNFPFKKKKKLRNVVIPAGSYVQAKLMTGIQSPEGKIYPSLLILESSYVGPNKTRIDLSGCFALAKTQASMATERIEFQVHKLSCVSGSGRMLERTVNGFVVDEKDQTFAVKGKLKSNQSRVASMAFMSSIVNGIGEIVSRKAQNIGGANPDVNTTEVLVQQGSSGAAKQVADWYLQQANNLSATLNVASNKNVYIVMNDKVKLPKYYFESKTKGRNANDGTDFINFISK